MTDEALNLVEFVMEHDLQAELVAPGTHMPTVDAAATAMGHHPVDRSYRA